MRARAIALGLVAVTLWAGVALAAPSEGDRSQARKLAYDGQEALEKKDYATAADRFERADALVHAPTLLLGLARAQVGLGKLMAATAIYRRIVNEGVAPRSPQPWFKAFEEAKAELALLKQRVPSLVIQITGGTASAVTVDGAPVNAGDAVQTDPGRHTVRATAEGFSPAETTVDAREGGTTPVTLELHTIAHAEVAPPPPPLRTSPRRVAGFIAVGFGGAAIALGGVTGGIAISKHDTLAKECGGGQCKTQKAAADLSSYHNIGLLSTIGFVGGGVLVAGGVVLVLTAPKHAPAETQTAIAIGPQGLTFGGTFR